MSQFPAGSTGPTPDCTLVLNRRNTIIPKINQCTLQDRYCDAAIAISESKVLWFPVPGWTGFQ